MKYPVSHLPVYAIVLDIVLLNNLKVVSEFFYLHHKSH